MEVGEIFKGNQVKGTILLSSSMRVLPKIEPYGFGTFDFVLHCGFAGELKDLAPFIVRLCYCVVHLWVHQDNGAGSFQNIFS